MLILFHFSNNLKAQHILLKSLISVYFANYVRVYYKLTASQHIKKIEKHESISQFSAIFNIS